MVNFNPQPLNYSVNSYGTGIQYATTIFNILNGRINPVFPARYLLVDNSTKVEGELGDNIGDVVQINIHNILKSAIGDNKGSPSDIISLGYKGLIAYVIIHELFHLEQDLEVYPQLTNGDEEIADRLIEDSCHCAALYYMNLMKSRGLIEFEFGHEFDNMTIPEPEHFIQWTRDEPPDLGRLQVTFDSFYTLKNPYKKIFWLIQQYIFDYPTQTPQLSCWDYSPILNYMKDGFHSILITIKLNDQVYKSDYVVYMDTIQPPSTIMGVIDILILLQKQGITPVLFQEGISKDYPGLLNLMICYETDYPILMQIVNQLPNGEQPIPSF